LADKLWHHIQYFIPRKVIIMAKVILYTKATCPYCIRAKELLSSKNVKYTEISIDGDNAKREEMMQKSQRQTVPQIFINDKHIGGCDDLYALHNKGQLDALLQASK
jgi:glutaredoxin 3